MTDTGSSLPSIPELPGVPPGSDTANLVVQMIRRAASPGFGLWWKKAEEAGFCANPIHLISTDTLERDRRVLTRCNNRRALVCPSCSDLYARDTWQLIHAGLQGGHHGIPASVSEHPQMFVTLTAPSFGAVHSTGATGICHPPSAAPRQCEHGRQHWCERAHNCDDLVLGQPLCADCYDYRGHVLFAWHAPELWRRFTIRLRRVLRLQLRQYGENPDDVRLSFMKVVELQRRGLPHFHAVIRLDAVTEPGEPPVRPVTRLTTADFAQLVRQAGLDIKISLIDETVLRFGEQLDIKSIGYSTAVEAENNASSSRHIARYLAKYVTKSVADFGVGVRRFPPSAIDDLEVTPHVRQILRTIVILAEREPYEELPSWLHTLGYRGHVMSKSRQFSTTMTALREHRAAWRKDQTLTEAEQATAGDQSNSDAQWEFERWGHTSQGDLVLVLSAFARAREQRFAARDALTEGA
jgi:hypothetical protein